ncbi:MULTISPECIES: T9SS type A sorting domain-containing protein [Chryseobacterium]|uniref:T9SS type A sorting domain-containing protein n=1 Tax=Chryseobacterium TaxID=59732 RepID=UPI00195A770D|nr:MULTISPECIES: T9SS type A sorting domain-containing protein [Chryseobacterium]MBM7420277.1 hypothetical protein [Chryseobacterium sp. JUb44]MDH6210221.1 hypothetical protein [Chryseobacterium sp. BIGb0186]WSO08937.1 T9SS type A sorting domain-containing protein [Chryseobacterium scophthalmum]
MKKQLFLAFFAFGLSNAQVFSENFNSGSLPSGWTVENPDTSANWAVGSTTFNTLLPSGAAYFDDDDAGSSSLNSNARLVSPIINLSSVTNPILSFKYANYTYLVDTTLKVEVYNGVSWTQVFTFTGDAGVWGYDPDTFDDVLESYDQATNINLTPYANANFKVRFVYDDGGDYSFGAVVDDVVITAGTLGTSEVSLVTDKIKLYPNPVRDNLFIQDADIKNYKVKVIDLSGKQVKTFEKRFEKYNLSELPEGAYIILIDDGKETIRKKIIKK